MRTAVRAMLLAALFLLVPASIAAAEPQYPPTTPPTKVTTTTTAPPSKPPSGGANPGLARTGSDSTPMVWAGIAAVAIGGVLVVGARRRATVRR